MTYGPIKEYYATIPTGAVSSTVITFAQSYRNLTVSVPSFMSTSCYHIQGSTDGVNYRYIANPPAQTSTGQILRQSINGAQSNFVEQMPVIAPYMKVIGTVAQTSTAVIFIFSVSN